MNVSSSVSLSEVLTTFGCALQEEQCWALAHQTLQELKLINGESLRIIDEKHLLITQNGTILIDQCNYIVLYCLIQFY